MILVYNFRMCLYELQYFHCSLVNCDSCACSENGDDERLLRAARTSCDQFTRKFRLLIFVCVSLCMHSVRRGLQRRYSGDRVSSY